MKKKGKKLYLQQKKRALKKIVGTSLKPRLAVFRSHKHIYGQLIDDQTSTTLAFSSTLDKKLMENIESTSTIEASNIIGKDLAKKAKLRNIEKIIFDRGTKPYHGRIKSLAEGARQEGLVF
jgi:large subunit ribosomal protein L18